MELTPDMLLKDRYRILRKLGQGGMGSVYLAHDESLDHEVAVKTNLNPASSGASQFLREARLLAALRHPNLPRVTDYFVLDEIQFLVMDYVPGKGLDEILRNEGPQPLGRVLPWVRQLGAALGYLHRQSPPVVHRDIKPGNIKLSAEGQAVLVDFGIAKAISLDQVTSTAMPGYTPGFAPPEQYGEGRAGPPADQYALAATIYTLLSGQKPSDAIQRLLGQTVLTPLNVLAPAIPPGVQAVVERALAIRPDDRLPEIEEMVRALESAAGAPAALGSQNAAVIQPPVRVPPVGPRTEPGQAGPPAYSPTMVYAKSPARKGLPLLLIAGIAAAGLLVLATVAVTAYILVSRKVPARPNPLPTATETSTTAPQRATARATAKPSRTPSPKPTETETPTLAPSATHSPVPATATPTLTQTLEASATSEAPNPPPASVGGGGVIAFASDRGDGKTFQIWTMSVSLNDQGQVVGGEPKQLTSDAGDKRQPRWSPDGSELLYVAPGGEGNGLDIWKMKADGSSPPVNLSKHKGNETSPAWSPDGKLIAFTEDQREDGVLQIYIMNSDGSGLYRLSTEQDESSPTWAPKMNWLGFVMNVAGNRIFYLRAPDSPDAVTPVPGYFVTPQPLDRTDLKGTLGQVDEPAWSPDGNWIAYTRLRNNGERFFLARFPFRLPDQDLVPLTEGSRNLSPAWSPDSQWIAFVSYRDGNPEIYAMRFTGKSQSRLTDAPGRDLDPAWQPLR